MYAIASAIDVAAQKPLVRLHEFGRLFRDTPAHGASETPVAPQSPYVKRIAQNRFDQLQSRFRPAARVEGDRDPAFEQCLERRFYIALGAAVRRVALTDDRKPHGATR